MQLVDKKKTQMLPMQQHRNVITDTFRNLVGPEILRNLLATSGFNLHFHELHFILICKAYVLHAGMF